MPYPRPCLDCGALGPPGATRCDPCRLARERVRNASRPHYRGDYRARARAVRAAAVACVYCGAAFTEDLRPQADHVIPRDPSSPLVAACGPCNSRKGDRLDWPG